MKKYILIITIGLACSIKGYSQQVAQYSQYTRNALVYNPGVTGIEDYTDVNLGFRKQWMNFPDAPQTYFLSAHGKLSKKDVIQGLPPYSLRISKPELYDKLTIDSLARVPSRHALGGMFRGDKYGPFKDYTGMISYAYHLPVSTGLTLSMGASAGVSHSSIDPSDLMVINPEDITYNTFLYQDGSHTYGNLTLGTVLYSDKLMVGYSANQMLQNNALNEITETGKLNVHHFLTAAYRFDVSDDMELYPSGMLKFMSPAPLTFDAGAKVRFKEKVWLGAAYRYKESIIGTLGLTFNEQFLLSYSYDASIWGIGNYNSGSHELNLGILLFNREKASPKFLW